MRRRGGFGGAAPPGRSCQIHHANRSDKSGAIRVEIIHGPHLRHQCPRPGTVKVHPTVVYSGLRSVISTSAVGLSSQDVFVQMAGGTPEGVIAAITMGFQKIIYVTSQPREVVWMALPSRAVELSNAVDYMNYQSPDLDESEKGFLAVEAVRMLAPYIKIFVLDRSQEIMVPPPFGIEVPPLQTFTYIAVTGRVVARAILGPSNHGADPDGVKTPESKKANKSSETPDEKKDDKSGGPGSSSGKVPRAAPKAAASSKIVKADEDMGEEEEDAEEDDESEEGGDDEMDDVKAIESLEQASNKNVGRPKAAGRATKGKVKGMRKKAAKAKAASKKCSL